MHPQVEKAGLSWLRGEGSEVAIRASQWAAAATPGGCAFFAPDFALSTSTPWLCGEEATLDLPQESPPRLIHRVEPASAAFARLHEDILRRIKIGEFAKVVPIACEELEFSAPLRAGMFAASRLPPPPGRFSYGFEMGDEGMCGLTPELLFSVRDGDLRTMALAGTGPAGGPSLRDDRKEMHEHRLVIDHIVSELKAWGTPEVGATEERTYGILKHLYTPIELRPRTRPEFMELVVRLHPTAALGGWPRRPAVEWLESQDFHFARKRFGAPFGYRRGDEMVCVVAIRGLQWWGARALIATGCGVVAESHSLREWDELRLKRQSLVEGLGLPL